jgi:hypothetical protein
MRKLILVATLAAMAVPPIAAADPPPWAPAHGRRAKERAMYDERGRYYEPQPLSREDRIWEGRDGRYYCKRDNGTTGLIVGGAVGALVGRELDGGRDRTVGTLVGAAGGALLGREIDRGGLKCR